ncbi:MAG: septum formation protein Maf [Bacteroidales bacterium]|nr:septum formation protein Maf [Bacteroidales bacterium]MBQ3942452.1 septum formation protein Maf [Bacteroidales bacterium]
MLTNMKKCSKRIILGSGSPRRRELLAGLDVDFTVDTANTFEESVPDGARPEDVPLLMSEGKSHGFHRPLEDDELLITADTVVIVDSRVLGKPHGREQAIEMLRELSGREHEVVSAVTFRSTAKELSVKDTTKVFVSPLSDEEIAYYVDTYRPFDKAGGYGIQEWLGFAAIGRIEGSFYNVMGFPVHRVWELLRQFD